MRREIVEGERIKKEESREKKGWLGWEFASGPLEPLP